MTALHWAVKRKNFKICEILIKNHSYLDTKDIVYIIYKRLEGHQLV